MLTKDFLILDRVVRGRPGGAMLAGSRGGGGLLRRALSTVPTRSTGLLSGGSLRHPFAVAQPWLGAYYSLREGDVAAMKNRDRRMDKAPQKRAAFMTAEIERREMAAAIEREPWRNLSNFDRGNIYEVEYRPMDGKVGSPDVTERVVGLCLGVHRRAFGASFRLLCKPDDCPTEYQFQIFSPTLLNVTLRQVSRTPVGSVGGYGRCVHLPRARLEQSACIGGG